MIQKLVFVANDTPILGSVITSVMNAPSEADADKIIKQFFESKFLIDNLCKHKSNQT